MAIAGWYRDPTGHGDGRYWDGQRWADQVNRQGVTMTSPMDPAGAETPPVAGTEYIAPLAPDTNDSPAAPTKSSPLAPVLGGLAVVVALIALIIALNSGDDGDDKPTTTSTTVEAPAATNPPDTSPPAAE